MPPRKILLIDDDRLQFAVTRALFAKFRVEPFHLVWSSNYSEGLERLLSGEHAACLLDFQLGERDGLELLREASERGCRTPVIFLTSESSENVDIQAMEAGALDYLIKGEITAAMLERSLRYALKLGETLERLHLLATRDELTGLLNRRAFNQALTDEIERARRFGRPAGLVLLDVDHFKSVNDRFGHPAGDHVLREVAKRISNTVRAVDRVGRYGGEEIAVLAAEAGSRGALETARRIVAAVRGAPVVLPDGRSIPITISAGAASFPEDADTQEHLVTIADGALYSAKSGGRNRAHAASGEPSTI